MDHQNSRNSLNILKNISIAKKMGLSFGLIVLLTVLMGVIGFNALLKVEYRMDKADDANRMVKSVLELRTEEKNYMLYDKDEEIESVHTIVEALNAQINAARKKFKTAENRAFLEVLEKEVKDYEENFDRYVEISRDALVHKKSMERQARNVEKIFVDYRAQQKAQLANLIKRNVSSNVILEEVGEADAANRMIKFMLEIRAQEKNFQLRQDEEYVLAVREMVADLVGQVQRMHDNANRQATKDLANNVLAELRDYLNAFNSFVAGKAEQAEILPRLLESARALEHDAISLRKDQKNELAADSRFSEMLILVVVFIAFILALLIVWLIHKILTQPLQNMTRAMERLANQDLETEIPSLDRKDEVGSMAKAVEVFKANAIERKRLEADQEEAEKRAEEEKKKAKTELADRFEREVGSIVSTVSSAATELQTTAEQLSNAVKDTQGQTNMAANGSDQANQSVQTMAAAAEEMSSAIQEVNSQVTRSAESLRRSVDKARDSETKMDALFESMEQIDSVVEQIEGVAEQTNLLALNATIEAARAGDAGKGFAVVASEVKELANQTQKMTAEIAEKIASIKDQTRGAVDTTREIVQDINSINETTSAIAGAMEEQTVTTQEISGSAQKAASGTNSVSESLSRVQAASSETSDASSNVGQAARELSEQSESLRRAVQEFLDDVRKG